ncbi:MAG: recombination mediator RecR [Bacteroidales bacterium]|jgi:recombination protein RecR|nr:recombination mediator RecR [Bacteroidales bacterium]MDD4213920.1 recombination mediator RecR [Bacteroidales bacterium]
MKFIILNFVKKLIAVATYPSKLFDQAVNEFAKLPGIGRKSAVRMVLHLLRENSETSDALGNAIMKLRQEIRYCKYCYNITENDVCDICANIKRNKSIICVVEDIRDVIAIENTNQYNGVYHILGGIISPMDGIGPADLNINELLSRVADGACKEVVLALPATIEGDTTNFFLYKKLSSFDVDITTIARGISFGDELEYADEVTLGRSIINRTPYQGTVQVKQDNIF